MKDKKPRRSGPISGPTGGQRQLFTRVKTARGRKSSSTRWLERQLNDPYVTAAKREGLRSRAAFKLQEMDDKYHILKRGHVVVDLGAAPGGWSQVAAQRCQSINGHGQIVAIDYLDFEALPGVDFIKMDFLEDGAEAALLALLKGERAHVVLSDMAAPTVGHKRTDHLRIIGLAEVAADFACRILTPGGVFLCKVFQGGTERTLLDLLKKNFKTVRHVKPPASRKDSAELYVLATGFRGSETKSVD